MSIRVLDRVWKQSRAKGGDLLVELAIADFADDEGNAYPSIPTLGKKSRLSDRQVKRSLQNLEHLGELKVLRGKGPHGTNRYKLRSDIVSCDNMSQGVTNEATGGDISGKVGVTPMSPNPSEETIRRNRHSLGASGFEEFWANYPRKKSKGDAEKAWKVLAPDEQLQGRISEAIKHAKKSEEWGKDGGRFIPYPATWLRAKGWEDELVSFALPNFRHGQQTNGHSPELAHCVARFGDKDGRFIKTCGKPLMAGELKYCREHGASGREVQQL